MKVLDDGSGYLEAGEKIPLKCPACGTYIIYSDDIAIVCPSCGHRDSHEEFADVKFVMETKQ